MFGYVELFTALGSNRDLNAFFSLLNLLENNSNKKEMKGFSLPPHLNYDLTALAIQLSK